MKFLSSAVQGWRGDLFEGREFSREEVEGILLQEENGWLVEFIYPIIKANTVFFK